MKRTFISALLLLACSLGAKATDLPGVTVEYLASGTESYVQALSAIGRIEFADGQATIVFKDASAGTEPLGALSTISRISFGAVSESDIKSNAPTADAPARTVTVTAHPNPVADVLHVEGQPAGSLLRLFGADGRVVSSTTSADVPVASLTPGIYFLQVGADVIKIIKK